MTNSTLINSAYILAIDPRQNSRIWHQKEKKSDLYSVIKSFSINEPKNWITNELQSKNVFFISATPSEETMKQMIKDKYGKFEKVRKVYVSEEKEITLVKVILEMETYDYNLMDEIFNEAEFPIKDQFRNKLIDFEYLNLNTEEEQNISQDYELIYRDSEKQTYSSMIFDVGENPLTPTLLKWLV